MSDLTSAEFAAAVGASEQRIRGHCRAGHLPGAYRVEVRGMLQWRIPAELVGEYRMLVGGPGRRKGKRKP